MPKREKSAQYPKATWNECIEFVRTVASLSLNAVSYTEVAKKYGLSSPTAKSFTSKLSTCKQFGLLETASGNTIYLTDTCKRILFPTGEDISETIKACFNMPPIYNKLVATYDGKALPTRDVLANIFMNDYGILNTVKDSAANAFMESLEQLGMLKGGVLFYANWRDGAINASEANDEPATVGDTPGTMVATSATSIPQISEADYIIQKIPFESGKIAQICIPVDANEDDLMLLHDMLDVIIKRKFKIDI